MGQTQLAQIAFSASEDKSATELGGAQPSVVNAIVDSLGAIRRRPGVVNHPDFIYARAGTNSPVIGMLPFGSYLVIVTADRKIYAYAPTPGAWGLNDISTTEIAKLAGTGRPSMVAGRRYLVMAGGAQIQKWDGTVSNTTRLANNGGGGPAPASSFVCAIAQRLVVQYATEAGQIWWSGPLEDYENWDMVTGGAGFIQAASKPDPIVALFDNTNEVFAFGTETIQVFAPAALAVDVNDPNNLLDFAPARTMNIGTVSPYSVVPVDDMFAMLDRNRRIIITDARTYTDISKPVASLLRSLRSIEDVWAFRMRFGRFDCIVFVFPTDGYGLIYNTQNTQWSEWRQRGAVAYDSGNPVIGDIPLNITCAYNWAERGVFLVGTSDGSVCVLDDETPYDTSMYQGIASADVSVRVEVLSGFIDHGSTAQKHCKTALFKFHRTQGKAPLPGTVPPYNTLESPSGHVRISKRDDQGAWKIVKDIELSSSRSPSIQIRSLGVYRTRQWKVEYTGVDELQLVSAQEEFEILGA